MKKLEIKKVDLKSLKGPKANDLKKLDAKTARLGLAALLVVLAVLIGGIALLSGGSGGGSSKSSPEAEGGPMAFSESELRTQASKLGHPVYWIGPRPGTSSYELSEPQEGTVYVRYLTGGAEAGDPQADYLTVGTYAVPEAAQALQKATTESEGAQELTQHEGYVVLGSANEFNAYIVFNDQPDLQVEIFSPQKGEAVELAGSGFLKPIG